VFERWVAVTFELQARTCCPGHETLERSALHRVMRRTDVEYCRAASGEREQLSYRGVQPLHCHAFFIPRCTDFDWIWCHEDKLLVCQPCACRDVLEESGPSLGGCWTINMVYNSFNVLERRLYSLFCLFPAPDLCIRHLPLYLLIVNTVIET
jgi:hypothetical protein